MTITPSGIGAAAEREVSVALARAGWRVYLPLFAPHDRVDLIAIEPEGSPLRVQCKTASVRGGALVFRTCSNTGNAPQTYDAQVDAFGVHAPELGRSFLVPAAGLPTRACHLRLTPSRNNQRVRTRLALD